MIVKLKFARKEMVRATRVFIELAITFLIRTGERCFNGIPVTSVLIPQVFSLMDGSMSNVRGAIPNKLSYSLISLRILTPIEVQPRAHQRNGIECF